MAAPSASPTGSSTAFRFVARLTREFWWLVKAVAGGFGRDHVSMLAKQTAYSLLYALPSLMVVLVALAAIIDKRTEADLSDALNRAIDERAPEELQPLLEHLVQHAVTEMSESTAGIAALISLLIAVWGVAGAVGTLVFACNLVYGIVDRRSYVARKVLTLVLTVGGGGLLVTAFILVTLGRLIGEWVEEWTDRQGVLVQLAANAGGWSIALVACSLAAIYALAPDARMSRRWILPGVGAATAAIYLEFVGFEYLIRLVDPGSAFGSAGSVLVLLWFLYLTSATVIVGAEINARLAWRHDAKLALFRERHPERCLDRGRDAG